MSDPVPPPYVADERPDARWARSLVIGTRRVADGLDEGGVGVWTVREIDAAALPGGHGPRCLIFESTRVVRRVWVFPAEWATLPDADVLRLADEAR